MSVVPAPMFLGSPRREANHGLGGRREKIRCHQERAGFGSLAIESATRWARAGGGPFVAASSRSISSTEENARAISCAPVCSIVSCFCSCRSFEGFGSLVQQALWKGALKAFRTR